MIFLFKILKTLSWLISWAYAALDTDKWRFFWNDCRTSKLLSLFVADFGFPLRGRSLTVSASKKRVCFSNDKFRNRIIIRMYSIEKISYFLIRSNIPNSRYINSNILFFSLNIFKKQIWICRKKKEQRQERDANECDLFLEHANREAVTRSAGMQFRLSSHNITLRNDHVWCEQRRNGHDRESARKEINIYLKHT